MDFHNLKALSHYLQKMVENKLWLKVLIAMVLGVIAGLVLTPVTGIFTREVAHIIANWLALPGTLFVKLVQMIMIPMIVTSIITGITSNSQNPDLGKTGVKLGIYFIITTLVAVIIGLTVAYTIQPGQYFALPEMNKSGEITGVAKTLPSWADLPTELLSVLPSNPLASMITGEMLSIVLFSIIVGVAITRLTQENTVAIVSLLSAVQAICMTIVKWAMHLAPYAVFGLMAQLIVNTGFSSILGLTSFMGSVLLGLFLLLLFYMILLKFIGRYPVMQFMSKIRNVQLLAFSMASSAAVMPLSIRTAEDELKISPGVANLVIPVGATVNMDGTALFQCMGTIFLAQIYGLDLSFVSISLLTITLIAASIGTPSIPGGGIIVMATVLQSVGIPAEGLMILIGIDRIMGMFRTAVNVTGDLTACVIFERWINPVKEKEEALLTS
jgi:Na+/H+-dicarboxylate symporter